jgi:hypothetical protein
LPEGDKQDLFATCLPLLAPLLPLPLPLPLPSSPSPLLPHRKKIATGNAIRENSRQAGSERDITEKKEMKKKQNKATK